MFTTSIPWGAAAWRILGEKTGAYTAMLSDDPAMFDKDKLDAFDAVVFNNNCGNPVADPVRRQQPARVRPRRQGPGGHPLRGPSRLARVHRHARRLFDQPSLERGQHGGGEARRAGHALWCELLPALRFEHTDEIFVFDRFSPEKVRVLLSLDTARTDMNKPDVCARTEFFPLSWIRRYGEGRVFYSALGHQKDVYWRPLILKHYLAGIQFALGDLEAPANLVFHCAADNDLYRVVTAGDRTYPRFDTPAEAVAGASEAQEC